MKTLKEWISMDLKKGYVKNRDEIDIELAMYLTGKVIVSEDYYEDFCNGAIQNYNEPVIVGSQMLYNTVYRADAYQPFRYLGQCIKGSARNMNPELSKKIFVCSRYRAESEDELKRNISDVKRICRKIVHHGDIPIAPHLYFPQFIEDENPIYRDFGIGAGVKAMEKCDEMLVIKRNDFVSDGMKKEIRYAVNYLGIPITTVHFDAEKR